MTEFTKGQKQNCFAFCKTNNLGCFQRDLNTSFAKILLADTYENIFNKIKINREANFYEYWSASQPIKMYIDYDKKIEAEHKSDKSDDKTHKSDDKTHKSDDKTYKSDDKTYKSDDKTHKSDILNIINCVKSLIPNITGVSILKSIPDIEKKSYHIIFDGIHFENRPSLKKFVIDKLEPKFKDLFEKKIIDIKVYGDLCFRTLLSTKCGQNRPLYLLETETFLNELQEIPYTKEDTTYEQFLKTCFTYIESDSVLFYYKSEKKTNNTKKIHLMDEEDIYSDKEVVKKYLDILDPDRYTDYNKWLNIGFILYSINPDYKDLWHYFSSKWENYDEKIASDKWNSFANSEYIYTLNNLMFLANVDNPSDEIQLSKDIPNHDIKYLRPIDNILSKLTRRLYGSTFVCSNPEKNEWYYFNGIRWKMENKNYNLRKKIIDEVFTKVEKYRRELIKERADDEIIKNYHNILLKLGSGIKLNCLELEFYNQNFHKIIDQDKDLIGFENGIYDLKTHEFRKGVSTDYVSLSTGYDYLPRNNTDIIYQELIELINKILPDADTRNFTMKSLASCLDGHTRDENFYIWSGKNASGGNGKSTLTDLLLKSLGDYACISPVALITGKRESANSPNSALANIRNKRAVIMQEPSANDLIQGDVMKSLTGGDKISTRDLNTSQIEFKPSAKFFLPCNRLPALSESDGGTARRIKITEFTSTFVDTPDLNNPRQFKIDRELKNKLDDYKSVFFSILLDYYRLYKSEGLVPPEKVNEVTKKYENYNNNIKTFIDENIIISNKSTDFITKDILKDLYKNDFNLRACFPKFANFILQLENTLCTEFKLDPKNKTPKIVGFSIRSIEEDDELDVL
jgi:P4 family phage/plasmid primase-like protien